MNATLRTLLLLVAAVGLLHACKVGRNHRGMGMTAPQQFRDTTLTADTTALAGLAGHAGLEWWTLFRDPVLDTLIHEALGNNRDLNAAVLRIDQAAATLAIRRADLAPRIGVQGDYTYGNYPLLGSDAARTNVFGGGVVAWELDLWGRLRRLNEAARAELLGTQLGVRGLRIDLVSAVASTYFQLLEFRTALDIAEETVALRDSMLTLIDARFRGGIAAEIELDQARIQLAIAAAAIPQYRRLIAATEHALSILVGRAPGAVSTGAPLAQQPPVPEIPVGLPSELLKRRPDILAAEQAVVAQNARAGAAVAQRFPTISLTGLLGVASADLASFTSGTTAYSISGGLFAPLLNWGQNVRRVEIERLRTEEATLRYEQSVLQALGEVQDALVAISTLKDEQLAREAHVKAAVNAQFLSQQRYDKGVTSYLEALESQRQAFESQLLLASVRRQLLQNHVLLYRALGGGWPTAEEKKAGQEGR